jgi:hypothetical protein
MNHVARTTLDAMAAQGVSGLSIYQRALTSAFKRHAPVFGRKAYADLYRRSARDPEWVALSLATFAAGEGDGAERLWDMAASTPDAEIAAQVKQHAIDEARHSRGYVTLLGMIFPHLAGEKLLTTMKQLSPCLLYTLTLPTKLEV